MSETSMNYCYEYPRPAVTVDIALFTQRDRQTQLLLIRRGGEPFAGKWALPGGFMEIDETLEQAAARELEEETGITDVMLRQFGVFSAVDRDPRGRVISVAYLAEVGGQTQAQAASDAQDARWFDIEQLPALAFDHDHVIARAIVACRDANRSG